MIAGDFLFKAYAAFLYEIKICEGVNNNAERISNIDRLITPLNRNTADGMIERVSALKILFFLQRMIHSRQ